MEPGRREIANAGFYRQPVRQVVSVLWRWNVGMHEIYQSVAIVDLDFQQSEYVKAQNPRDLGSRALAHPVQIDGNDVLVVLAEVAEHQRRLLAAVDSANRPADAVDLQP